MEKYIIAVDMDGTLLNSENKISERTRNVLQRLIDEGPVSYTHLTLPTN